MPDGCVTIHVMPSSGLIRGQRQTRRQLRYATLTESRTCRGERLDLVGQVNCFSLWDLRIPPTVSCGYVTRGVFGRRHSDEQLTHATMIISTTANGRSHKHTALCFEQCSLPLFIVQSSTHNALVEVAA